MKKEIIVQGIAVAIFYWVIYMLFGHFFGEKALLCLIGAHMWYLHFIK